MKFEHRINVYDLWDYCVKHNLCTCCNNEEYMQLLQDFSGRDLTPEDISTLEMWLYKYSDKDNEKYEFGFENFKHSLVYDGVVKTYIVD